MAGSHQSISLTPRLLIAGLLVASFCFTACVATPPTPGPSSQLYCIPKEQYDARLKQYEAMGFNMTRIQEQLRKLIVPQSNLWYGPKPNVHVCLLKDGLLELGDGNAIVLTSAALSKANLRSNVFDDDANDIGFTSRNTLTELTLERAFRFRHGIWMAENPYWGWDHWCDPHECYWLAGQCSWWFCCWIWGTPFGDGWLAYECTRPRNGACIPAKYWD